MMSKEYRKSTERIPPHRLQREKRNAKAERWERPQRKAVSAYFGRETIVWCNPGRISPRGAQDEGGTPKLRESRRPFYKSPLWACTHYGGHSAQDLVFDTVEAYIKHILKNIGGAGLDKIYAGKTTHFVFTIPFSSENHPKQKRVDAIIVELHEESKHWHNQYVALHWGIYKEKKRIEEPYPQ